LNQQNANELNGVRTLRTRHGLSVEALAKHCALSIRQLQQIEEGGHDAFYSQAIKQLAVRKVLDALQAPEKLVCSPNPRREPRELLRFSWEPRVLQFNQTGVFKATRTARGV
jgi:transcriptional regulator with XRE-family HTH domain